MKVLIVTGIWPPDVGGPASHAADAARELAQRGHEITVLTTASRAPAQGSFPVRWISRRLPLGARHAAVAARVAELSARADVVYALSMVGRSAFGARAPLVVKVAGDPAYERSVRRGLYDGTVVDFQRGDVGVRADLLRRWRTATIRRAAQLVCPSEFLRGIVIGWGIDPNRVSVVPNPIPHLPRLHPRDELRTSFGIRGRAVAFAGRLTAVKNLPVLIDAVARIPDVTLLVAGDGELRRDLEAQAPRSVEFLGALDRDRVLELFAAADVVALSSVSETFSHVLVEALAVGTPVVATAVGAVPEIVRDGENGLLVPSGDTVALASAIERAFADDGLRARAAASVHRFERDAVFDRLESLLLGAASG